MKKCFYFFALVAIACTDHTPENNNVFNDPNWFKLEIPAGREAFAVAGSIDDTLLVSTWTKVYYTADQGKTWKESRDFQGPVMGFLERNDTIFSLRAGGSTVDQQGHSYASLAQYCTVDHGISWKYIYEPHLKKRIRSVTASSGTEYFLKENLTPFTPGYSGGYINPTDVMIRSGADAVNISFPYKHQIHNLHIDSEDRLYIIASGGIHNEERNTFYCCDDTMPAIVYVSKRPMR
jgi:hypothetical protein